MTRRRGASKNRRNQRRNEARRALNEARRGPAAIPIPDQIQALTEETDDA